MTPSEYISKRFGLASSLLQAYAKTCPKRYKTYPIDKVSGGKRYISQPSRALKSIQRAIIEQYFSSEEFVHFRAMAYVSERSIKDNAKVHAENRFLLKLDFLNFFGSIDAQGMQRVYDKAGFLGHSDPVEIEFLNNIFLKATRPGLRLSIGAPSSPAISNIYMFAFDEAIHKICLEMNVEYSRYADDIAFSTNEPDVLDGFQTLVRKALNDQGYSKIRVNKKKTVYTSKKYSRRITGLVITNDGNVSIGRDRKREIRTRIFQFDPAIASEKERQKLQGLIAFAKDIEPLFYDRLKIKYGDKLKSIAKTL